MAGISILLADFLLIIVLISSFIGFVLFLISLILLLKKKNSQNNGKNNTRKTIAIIILVISLLFQIPLGITISGIQIHSEIQNNKDKEKLKSIENKVSVRRDEWQKGFEYNGKHLVPINIFMNSDNYHSHGAFKNLEKVGALVIKNSYDYYSLYQIDNNSGYKIYYVWVESFTGGRYYSRTFVDKNDYDSVLKYYSTANLSVNVLWQSAPEKTGLKNSWAKLDLNINKNRNDLIKLSHSVLDDVSNKKQAYTSCSNGYNCISFKIKSDDGVFSIDLSAYTKNNEMILYLNEYKVESTIVEKYKETLFSLINDSQTELLQKTNIIQSN